MGLSLERITKGTGMKGITEKRLEEIKSYYSENITKSIHSLIQSMIDNDCKELVIWHSMLTAPTDKRILVYSESEGVYETKYEDGEWPHYQSRSDHDLESGVCFPRPSYWQELPEAPK